MKNKRFDIAREILVRIDSELAAGIPQKAEGRTELQIGGIDKKFWIVRNEIQSGAIKKIDITGDTVAPDEVNEQILKVGTVISRNSPLGNAIAEVGGLGTSNYKTLNDTITFKINDIAQYLIDLHGGDAKQGRILVEDEDVLIFEESLRKEIAKIACLIRRYEVEKETAGIEEIQALSQRIADLKAEQLNLQENSKRYRRTSISIRQQFMLDPEQNIIKRAKLFNGPLIINGGPGTGKTTCLIHRIQYLIDKQVEEDENLKVKIKNADWQFIRNQRTGWIFFSPTVLLQRYLTDAMSDEKLDATSETVRVWDDHRIMLINSFGHI